MFRNQYDNDVTTWSPQGRLHQVEYAMEAVKQGSCAVGLKSKTHVVLLGLKRSANELSTHQRKLLKIDDHIAVAIAGLTSDARVLSKFMRTECLHEKYSFDTPLPVERLVATVGDKAQVTTQRYGRRPYGVGLLVAGFDQSGPRLFQQCPSANYFDCLAMSIGARSQSARTYLERNLEKFSDSTREELITHGMCALRDSLPNNSELTTANTSVIVISATDKCVAVSEDELATLLESIETSNDKKKDGDESSGTTDDIVVDEGAAEDDTTSALDATPAETEADMNVDA